MTHKELIPVVDDDPQITSFLKRYLEKQEYRVIGLEFGADDYMVKPFESREFPARISTILRLRKKMSPDDPTTQGIIKTIHGIGYGFTLNATEGRP